MAGASFATRFAAEAERLDRIGANDQEIADFYQSSLRSLRSSPITVNRKAVRAASSRKRMAANPSLRIRKATGSRIWAGLKGITNGSSFSRLPYSLDDLVMHLEGRFCDGMSWANYGKWHVDHVKPCALFDLTNPKEFQQCWALANLQPLWAAENCAKGAKYASA